MSRKKFSDFYEGLSTESHAFQEEIPREEGDGDLSVSTEDWTGGAASILGSMLPGVGFFVSPAARTMLKAKEKELEKLTASLKALSVDAGKQAVADGKMDANSFHKLESADPTDFLVGALIQFVPFYNLYKMYTHGSDLQDTMKKIEDVKAEIDAILRKAAIEQAKR